MQALRNLFISKGYSANPETGLWPNISGGNLINFRSLNYLLFDQNPTWRSLNSLDECFTAFHNNPIVHAIIMIKAREWMNMNIQVKRRKDDSVVAYNTREALPRKLYDIWDRPNPLQSRGEFLMQAKIQMEVGANAFIYHNFLYKRKAVEELQSMWNVWPQYMQYIRGRSYFDAQTMDDIITKWKFEAGSYKKEWDNYEILFSSKANTDIQDDVIFGRPQMYSHIYSISNIDAAYRSRNVMIKNRGMRLIFSSGGKDAVGNVPLMPNEVEDIEKRWGRYGTLESQQQVFFSPYPLTVTPIDQDVRKLGLFDEVAQDALILCHEYGVPEILLRMFLASPTFENQEASLRRLYQSTLMPEAEEYFNGINKYWGLENTPFYLWPDFSHVPCLQTDLKTHEDLNTIKSNRYINEIKAGLLTKEEYRQLMGYGLLPDELKESEDESTTGETTEEQTSEEENADDEGNNEDGNTSEDA